MKGFTLLELIIAIAIIGVLASIGLVSYQGLQQNNRDQTRYRDLTSLKQALELYRHDRHYYPASIAELVPKYTQSIPVDPDDANRAYFYRSYDNTNVICNPTGPACTKYLLCASGEGNHDFGDPGSCSSNNCGTVRCNMSIINQ